MTNIYLNTSSSKIKEKKALAKKNKIYNDKKYVFML